MRTSILLLLVSVSLLSGCTSTRVITNISSGKTLDSFDKYTIAVVSSLRTPESIAFSDMLSTELLGLGFHVIERNRIEAALEEQKLSLSGVLEKSNYDTLGKIANLDGIFIFLAKYDGKQVDSCILKLIDVKTGELLLSTNYKAAHGSEMIGVAEKISASIRSKFQSEDAIPAKN